MVTDHALFSRLTTYIEQDDETVILATVVRGPDAWLGARALIPATDRPLGPLLESPWREPLLQDARRLMAGQMSTTRRYPASAGPEPQEVEIFYDLHRPSPRLVIVGAVHIARDLVSFARPLGYRTYLVDPRAAFATAERFPHVDELVTRWPDEALPDLGLTGNTAVVVVTHDPKLDDPALLVALPGPAFYVGALGSPTTHAKRLDRLRAAGLNQAQLERLHAPIGLDLGARSPAEIALSIMAEIVAVRNQAVGR